MIENSSAQVVVLSVILRSMWRHRIVAGTVGAVIMATAGVVYILLPKTYESTASILPAQEEGGLGGFLDANMGGAAPLAASLLGSKASGGADLFPAMLQSRVMADAIIAKFDLMSYFQVQLIDDARRALAGCTTVDVGKEGALFVSVVTEDPKLSADIANFYVSNLDRLNRTMTITKAGQSREFLEARVAEVKITLVKAEDDMRDFQSKNKAFAVEEQARAMVEGAATLQGQLTAQEIQLKVARSYLSEENPELVRLRAAVAGLRGQLKAVESGPGGEQHASRVGHPSMEAVPSLALSYARLLRDVRTQEQIYILLVAQLEQAKLQEARDTPTVQVMDPAVPAMRKKGPKLSLIGIVALLFSVAAAALLSRVLDARATRLRPFAKGA